MYWIPVVGAVTAILAAGLSLFGVLFTQQRQDRREFESWRRKEAYEAAIQLVTVCNTALYSRESAEPKALFAELNSCYSRLYGLVPNFHAMDRHRLLSQFKNGDRDRSQILDDMQDVAILVLYGLNPNHS